MTASIESMNMANRYLKMINIALIDIHHTIVVVDGVPVLKTLRAHCTLPVVAFVGKKTATVGCCFFLDFQVFFFPFLFFFILLLVVAVEIFIIGTCLANARLVVGGKARVRKK